MSIFAVACSHLVFSSRVRASVSSQTASVRNLCSCRWSEAHLQGVTMIASWLDLSFRREHGRIWLSCIKVMLTTAPCAPNRSLEQLHPLCILLCSRRACYPPRTRICLQSPERRRGSDEGNGRKKACVGRGIGRNVLPMVSECTPRFQCIFPPAS